MTKTVNIQATIPVRTLAYPICGVIKNIEMEVGDIFKCICGRAFVDEILSDGTLLRLSMENYNQNNEVVVEVKDEEPPVEEVPPVTSADEYLEEEAPLAPQSTAPVEEVVDETPVATAEAEVVVDEEAAPDTEVVVEEVPVTPVHTPAKPNGKNKK